MAMGKRKSHDQPTLFIPTSKLPQSAAHPFYAKLNEVLAGWKFDEFVEGLCAKFYEEKIGRPSLEPGKYFRLLLIGYFEGIDSERGIARKGFALRTGAVPIRCRSVRSWDTCPAS